MRHLPHWHQSDLHTILLSDQCGAYGKKNRERLWPAVVSRVGLIYVVVKLLMTSLDLSQSAMTEDNPKFMQTSCSVWNKLLHSANVVNSVHSGDNINCFCFAGCLKQEIWVELEDTVIPILCSVLYTLICECAWTLYGIYKVPWCYSGNCELCRWVLLRQQNK